MTKTVFVQGGSLTDDWCTLVPANPYPAIRAEATCDGKKVKDVRDLDGPGFYEGSVLVHVAGEKILSIRSYKNSPISRELTPVLAAEGARPLMRRIVRDLAVFLEEQIKSVGDVPVVVSWSEDSGEWVRFLLRPTES